MGVPHYILKGIFMSVEKGSKRIYNDGYVEGHNDGWRGAVKAYDFGNQDKEEGTKLNDNELESIIDDTFQEGYTQAYSEIHAPTTERERQLQEKAWDEGYVSAVEDYLAQGDAFIGNACYVRCSEFGAVGDCESGHLGEKFDVTEGVNVIDFIKKNFDNIKSFTQVGDVGSIEMFDKFNIGVCGSNELEKELSLVEKYPHYYKDIRHLNIIDIYRFFDLFEVTDPCLQHSMKKLAVGGKRGAKDYEKDIKEAMDTLSRWEYMQEENKRGMDD